MKVLEEIAERVREAMEPDIEAARLAGIAEADAKWEARLEWLRREYAESYIQLPSSMRELRPTRLGLARAISIMSGMAGEGEGR